MHWRRKWQPTPVFLPGESQGQRSLVGCHLWGRPQLDNWSDLAAGAAYIYATSSPSIHFSMDPYVGSMSWLLQIMLQWNTSHKSECYAMLCYAKSLQSCPTLCDPIDGSPPGSQNGHHQKSLQILNARECVEKREPSCTVGRNVNWYRHYEEQYGGSLKKKKKKKTLKIELPYDPEIPLLGI